jgi:CDP-glucose 4,6-dehydratase
LLGQKLRENPLKWRGSWNFGPNTSDLLTVGEVASTMISEFGKGSIEVQPANSEEHESELLKLNCDKANQLLNWRPTWNSSKTLLETASWYKRVLAGDNAISVTREQINNFLGEKSD